MAKSFDLSGKIALVTGASGGLGRHFAGVLAGAGARVAVCARRMDKVTETVAGIESAGGRAFGVEMDVTDKASVVAAFDVIEEQAGPVTVLINNAGITASNLALEMSEDDWDRVLDTNLKGAWTVAQQAAQRMAQGNNKAETGGVIVNIASVLGLRVGKGVLPYAVSKAGLIQMTKALALELAPRNIRVNALAPGYVETDLTRDYLASDAGKKLLKRIPQRRLAGMEELSGPLLLLASDASSYMTGAVIAVDGGHLVSSL
jgi:NAD(P)-dependent dehydrogenase (short-subunit alcohol dehydrogenase family)